MSRFFCYDFNINTIVTSLAVTMMNLLHNAQNWKFSIKILWCQDDLALTCSRVHVLLTTTIHVYVNDLFIMRLLVHNLGTCCAGSQSKIWKWFYKLTFMDDRSDFLHLINTAHEGGLQHVSQQMSPFYLSHLFGKHFRQVDSEWWVFWKASTQN